MRLMKRYVVFTAVPRFILVPWLIAETGWYLRNDLFVMFDSSIYLNDQFELKLKNLQHENIGLFG